MRHWVGAAVVLVAATVVGCADTGPKRHRLSGEVKYDGQPIPYGDIVFTPDAAKKNDGPQGFAKIRDGRYETEGDKGIGGGPTILHVTGFSGPDGKGIMCEVDISVDLPRDGGTHDITIPKQPLPTAKKGPEI